MSRPKPSKLILAYEDDTTCEVSCGDLPSVLVEEILRQPFASSSNSGPKEDRHVLIEWEDGWKEVVAVPGDCEGLSRYRVLVRPEEVGGLSLKRAGGYPELVEIERKPLQVKHITFGDSFSLEQSNVLREGKKREFHYSLKKGEDRLGSLRREFQEALSRGEFSENPADEPGQGGRQADREKFCRRIGLVATHRRQDVLDFLSDLLGEDA